MRRFAAVSSPAALAVATLATVALLLPAASARAAERLTDDAIVARLRDYLRIDTSNPPGNEMKAARFFKEWFDAEGIASEIFEYAPGRAVIRARLPGNGSRRPLLLANHMDVVQAERPYWSVDPFAGTLKDGFLYGRGALDMKTTGLLEAATMVNLRRSGTTLSRDILFLGTSDEEVEASAIDWVVNERPDLVRDAEFALNEGSVIDAVGGKAQTWSVAVTEKCPFWLRVTAKGRPGHGSMPFKENNAVLHLLKALGKIAAWETPIRVTDTAAAYFRARAASQPATMAAAWRDIRKGLQDPAVRRKVLADPALNAILRNTIAITVLEGGPQTNVIPTVAEAQLDVRLLPGEDPDAFLAEIRRRVDDASITIEPLAPYRAATESPLDSEIMRAIERARARHTPAAILAPTMLTGWTESATLRTLGIKAYGFEPYVLDSSEQDRQHGNDERIAVENVLNGARILEEIVLDVAR
ncbi:MAG TPA: M20/M25/M40 family metallo-hydrolase [Candidatus Polarisedimenticolia bacterium]|nr:M20/M25/M40 family metallo-hydrolase [Candidatus Polarisedimenticolia bacterium]